MTRDTMPHDAAVATSYRLLALLSVCQTAASSADSSNESDWPVVAGNLATCMSLAGELAVKLHDNLELAGKAVQS